MPNLDRNQIIYILNKNIIQYSQVFTVSSTRFQHNIFHKNTFGKQMKVLRFLILILFIIYRLLSAEARITRKS